MISPEYNPIEDCLKTEAEQLPLVQPPTQELIREHQRRVSRRRFRIATGAGCLLLFLAASAGIRLSFSTSGIAETENDRPSPTDIAFDELPAPTPPVAPEVQERTPTLAATVTVPSDSSTGSPNLLPVFLVRETKDGKKVIIPNIHHHPRQLTPRDLEKLTPIERRAIRQVLGIPQSTPPSAI